MGFLYAMYGPSMMNNCTKGTGNFSSPDDDDDWDDDDYPSKSSFSSFKDDDDIIVVRYTGTAEEFISNIKSINPSIQLDNNYDYVRVVDEIDREIFYIRPSGYIKFRGKCITSYKVKD